MLSVPHEKRFTEGLGVPYCTHSSFLPVTSEYLPLSDKLCCRTAFLSKAVQNQIAQLFLLLPVMVFTVVV